MKVGNTLSTINYNHRPAKLNNHNNGSSSSDDDGSRCSYDSNYDHSELNRNLFIENYLIGRGVHKARSSSLTEDALHSANKDVSLKRNNRRKSLMEKRDDRLKINRNCLFSEKSCDNKHHHHHHKRDGNNNRYYEMDDEKSAKYDYIESSAPSMKKICNINQEFVNLELSICINLHLIFFQMRLFFQVVKFTVF